jgi:hypothetical protein
VKFGWNVPYEALRFQVLWHWGPKWFKLQSHAYREGSRVIEMHPQAEGPKWCSYPDKWNLIILFWIISDLNTLRIPHSTGWLRSNKDFESHDIEVQGRASFKVMSTENGRERSAGRRASTKMIVSYPRESVFMPDHHICKPIHIFTKKNCKPKNIHS